MTQENYLKSLELESKRYKKEKDLFDIIVYGSFVRGKRKSNDIDVVFIFNNTSLEKRAEITQKFKQNIKSKNKNIKIDVKTINLHELFSEEFFARQGIIIEGYSLLDKKPLQEKLGFESFEAFVIETKSLSNTKKVRFSYALNGRGEEKGFLEKVSGKRISQKVILIPIKNSELFREFLEKMEIKFKSEHIIMPKK